MIDNSKEYIICAAIHYEDFNLIKNPELGEIPKGHLYPINIEKGIVFCGHRHLQCLYQAISITGKRQCEMGKEMQGFLTNKNRFVNRKEADVIAYEAKQTEELKTWLFSEDIY